MSNISEDLNAEYLPTCTYLNRIKGVSYLHEYEWNEQFKKDLMEEYPFIDDVTDAPSWNLEAIELQHFY